MKIYSDFIGIKIEIEVNPFQFKTAVDALEFELKNRIKKEVNYFNGLLYNFRDIQVSVNNKILISGIVTQCEVDC